MKKIFPTFAVFFLLFSCSKNFFNTAPKQEMKASSEFVQGSEDVPLMSGLEKTSDESLGFDSTSGSIVSSIYETTISASEVKNFYIKTLPQLGWKIEKKSSNKLTFKRDEEHLEIELKKQSNKGLVQFFISSNL